ncbi:MAG TPA: PQQ-dependent sugar dehydrogenase [Baekduia sp.]|nr:PQQ-dependent sugar dehydrogenase [Baekduia sp.]
MWRFTLSGVLIAAFFAAGCGDGDSSAQTTTGQIAAGAKVKLKRIGNFDAPLYLTAVPGDRTRQYIVEQGGRIVIVRNGKQRSTPFLDITAKVTSEGERGLLGLAFPRDHATSGLFYVYYTGKDLKQHLVEYKRASPDAADPASAREVFAHADPEPNHNGGQLQFGPDGLLYVGTGDGGGGDDQHGSRGNAQDLGSPLGKILRIDPKAGSGFKIPAGNPFVGRAGARGEIYSYGLRNPWRFSFDRKTGALVIGDVGQNAVEEIDYVKKGAGAGANFGWRPFEGTAKVYPNESVPGHVKPVIEKTHSNGWCSITGGYVVRDRSLGGLYGKYVYGDFCKGKIYSARLSSGKARANRATNLKTISQLSSFGEDAAGRVYVISLDGPVYRLVR